MEARPLVPIYVVSGRIFVRAHACSLVSQGLISDVEVITVRGTIRASPLGYSL